MSFKELTEKLDKQSKELIDNGYFLFDVENKDLLFSIREKLLLYMQQFNAKINKLSDVHKFIKIEELNDIRLGFYNEVNKSQDFSEKYLELGFQVITNVVGTELAANKNVNFSKA